MSILEGCQVIKHGDNSQKGLRLKIALGGMFSLNTECVNALGETGRYELLVNPWLNLIVLHKSNDGVKRIPGAGINFFRKATRDFLEKALPKKDADGNLLYYEIFGEHNADENIIVFDISKAVKVSR